ncbi:MAG: hypothetical protein D6791_16175 [Chloroflexi bacterium]|nr:MAG: hypothetical protein D6791_16175 [Chloroflexota bacterium]
MCIGHQVGVSITNRGSAGKVTINATMSGDNPTHTEVIWMDSGEKVTAKLEVGCYSVGFIEWTAHPTQPGDVSDGVIMIER